MMEKLKTLKNFNKLTYVDGDPLCGKDEELVDVEELREEAIKWIKSIPSKYDDDEVGIDWEKKQGVELLCSEFGYGDDFSGKSFIMKFFSITAEDLK